MSWFGFTVDDMNTDDSETTTMVADFFGRYAEALLARDEDAVATMYAVPGLILFPGQTLVVDDPDATREFFASSWQQYDGVTEADPDVEIVAAAEHSVWAAVDWRYDGQVREHFMYQLLRQDDRWQIAVLTPLNG